MSERNDRPGQAGPDPHTLVGPYVVDALPPDERDLFEDHLSRCPECQAEAAELLAAAAHLGQAAAVVPPAALRQQVLAEVARTRQVAPGGPISSLDEAAEARRRNRWLAPLAAAAVVAVLAAVGAVALQSDHRADRAEELAAVIAAPDAQEIEVSGEGGTMRLVVSDSHDSSVVVADGMAPPPDGKTYVMWFQEGEEMIFQTTFAPDEDGSVRARIDDVPSDVVGVTVEDEGDIDSPTLPPVATGSL